MIIRIVVKESKNSKDLLTFILKNIDKFNKHRIKFHIVRAQNNEHKKLATIGIVALPVLIGQGENITGSKNIRNFLERFTGQKNLGFGDGRASKNSMAYATNDDLASYMQAAAFDGMKKDGKKISFVDDDKDIGDDGPLDEAEMRKRISQYGRRPPQSQDGDVNDDMDKRQTGYDRGSRQPTQPARKNDEEPSFEFRGGESKAEDDLDTMMMSALLNNIAE